MRGPVGPGEWTAATNHNKGAQREHKADKGTSSSASYPSLSGVNQLFNRHLSDTIQLCEKSLLQVYIDLLSPYLFS